MKPSEYFVQLTSHLCSSIKSEQAFAQTHLFGDGFVSDGNGNIYYDNRKNNENIMFCCHMDTVGQDNFHIVRYKDSRFIFTDGKSQLGADDRAGIALCLYLIEKDIPGLYYFFSQEEKGAPGSSALADDNPDIIKGIDIALELDRKGYNDIIYVQGRKTASYECANSIGSELAKQKIFMSPCDNGVFTDTANLTTVIRECLNLSVGYFNQHTYSEYQDVLFLDHLGEALSKVNWSKIVVAKDLDSKIRHHKAFGYGCSWGGHYSTKSSSVKTREINWDVPTDIDLYSDLLAQEDLLDMIEDLSTETIFLTADLIHADITSYGLTFSSDEVIHMLKENEYLVHAKQDGKLIVAASWMLDTVEDEQIDITTYEDIDGPHPLDRDTLLKMKKEYDFNNNLPY